MLKTLLISRTFPSQVSQFCLGVLGLVTLWNKAFYPNISFNQKFNVTKSKQNTCLLPYQHIPEFNLPKLLSLHRSLKLISTLYHLSAAAPNQCVSHLNHHSVYNISHAGGVICPVAVNAASLLEVVVQLTVLRTCPTRASPPIASTLPAFKNQRQDLKGTRFQKGYYHFHPPMPIYFQQENYPRSGSPSVYCEKRGRKLCTKRR